MIVVLEGHLSIAYCISRSTRVNIKEWCGDNGGGVTNGGVHDFDYPQCHFSYAIAIHYYFHIAMKSSSLFLILSITFEAPSALSLLILSDFFGRISHPLNPASYRQEPIMNIANIVLPPSKEDDGPSEGTDGVIISDVIGKDRIINIFAGFTRDIDNISRRLDDSSRNTTVLAPLNSEIQKLPRKPWESPKDYEELGTNAYAGSDGEDRAHRNLRRFVEAHVIPVSPWKEGERVESVGGGKVWWESHDGKKLVDIIGLSYLSTSLIGDKVQPGHIEVSSVASRVSNGEVWILKGALNYE